MKFKVRLIMISKFVLRKTHTNRERERERLII